VGFHTQILKQRRAGVLLHVSSLPNKNLGQDAFKFVDFLARTGATVWQTLPLNMPHGDGSPYQCLSAHAGNPAFISVELLKEQGLLSEDDLNAGLSHQTLLEKACAKFNQADANFLTFCDEQSHWLHDFLYLWCCASSISALAGVIGLHPINCVMRMPCINLK